MPKPLWAPWRLAYVEHADELDRCIFCEPEQELVVQNGAFAVAVMNKFPYSSGHVLVAPHRHLGDFGLLSPDEVQEVHSLAARAVDALRSEYGATASTSVGTSAVLPARGSRTTCTSTSSHAGTATRASCRCSAT